MVEYSNKRNNKSDHENNTQTRDLHWIRDISPKMKGKFKRIDKDIAFTSGKNIQQSLCHKNKPKLLPNSQPGVYQLDCSRNGKYIGESKKRVLTRCIEDKQDSMSGK